MKQKIVVLGAGVYQVPLIKKLRDQFYVIAVSYNNKEPGYDFAQDSWVLDVKDKEAIYKECKKAGIQGILTTGTDVAIPTIGYVNDRLGLLGLSEKQAFWVSNKISMKERFQKNGISTPAFLVCNNIEKAMRSASVIGYPVMVKATDSSGSRGINKVMNPEMLQRALNEAVKYSNHGNVILEQYLEGLEFGAQLIVSKGKVLQVIPHNDIVKGEPISVPVAHSVPFKDPVIMNELIPLCNQLMKAFELYDAICNLDLMYANGRVYIMEIAGRIGATGIPEIIQSAYGVDLYQLQTDMIMGRSVVCEPKLNQFSSYSVIRSEKAGIFYGLDDSDTHIPSGVQYFLEVDKKEGEAIRSFRIGPDRIGSIHVTGTHPSVLDLSEKFHQQLILNLK